MTTHDITTSPRRSFFARLVAGAGALAAAIGSARGSASPASADGPPSSRPRITLHPDAVPRTSDQSTTHG